MQDTTELHKEYLHEDKNKYELLFARYFPNTEYYSIYSIDFCIANWINTICIVVDRYPQVETYFCSCVDLNAYADVLRKDPKIREMTKLCFYIKENISTYNTIDKDLKELNNIREI